MYVLGCGIFCLGVRSSYVPVLGFSVWGLGLTCRGFRDQFDSIRVCRDPSTKAQGPYDDF